RMCLLMVMLAVIGLVCSITAQYFASKAAVGMATSMRHYLFEHIQTLSFTEMDSIGAPTLITRMTSDINQVQNATNLVLRLFLRSPFIVFGAMIMAFTIDVKAALVFVVTIPLLSIVIYGIMLLTKPLYKKVQNGLDKILEITRENLTGVRVIRAFGKEKQEVKEFIEANESLTAIQKYAGRFSGLMNPMTYIIINASVIALIWVGAIRVNNAVLTQGQVVALYNYMSQILVEMIKLANLIISMTKALACMNRITNIFEQRSSMQEGSVKEKHFCTQKFVPAKSSAQTSYTQKTCSEIEKDLTISPKDDYAVEFHNVSLTYQNAGDTSLTDITFAVRKGETIGIIGGTGSGKTSLVNLIPRFYDATKGEVLVDGINVKDYTFEALNHKVSVVPQKAQLFKGNIKDNLLFGNQNASTEDMYKALEISQAMEFVAAREEKLLASVEQGGKNLSGGQKQRLTIARALVKKAEILILDDSASALDYATDAKLRRAIRTMEQAPTVFIVSQRASSIMYADQIIVMENGQMAGIGKHEELLENCEVYQEIYYSQFQKEA
ncbi:MAG TPA: ABC transporter ATP-binding protein, partial [Clostridia bacterium]|nr:ABC transporter ATP-binding protein [Clostridia bacterium]